MNNTMMLLKRFLRRIEDAESDIKRGDAMWLMNGI